MPEKMPNRENRPQDSFQSETSKSSPSPIYTINVTKAIFLPATAAVILIGLLVFSLLVADKTRGIEIHTRSTADMIDRGWRAMMSEHAKLLAVALESIVNDDKLMADFAARDLASLQQRAVVLFSNLKSKHGITHTYFLEPDGKVFFRAHTPQRRGDVIQRTTFRNARASKSDAWGLEMGPLGTFTLRYVSPIIFEGKITGLIETGAEIEHMTTEYEAMFQETIFVCLKKSATKKEHFEAGKSSGLFTGSWDKFSGVVVLQGVSDKIPQSFAGAIETGWLDKPGKIFSFSEGDQDFSSAGIRLYDAAQEHVGWLLVVRNVSQEIEQTTRVLLLALGGVATISALLILLLFQITLKANKRILNAMELNLKFEAALQNSKHLESIGILAGGMAHDINSLLFPITGNAELIKMDFPDDHPAYIAADKILMAGERCADLVRQLLAFARKQTMDSRILDLNHIVRDFSNIVKCSLGRGIKLNLQMASGQLYFSGDPGQIDRILLNLATNARDAMPEGGEFTISTGTREFTASNDKGISINPSKSSDYVTLTVSDTGSGMNQETVGKVFEPFFTTKEIGEGSGLGLSTVHGIVGQHGGHVEIESEVGRGTKFTIYLPRVSGNSV